MKVLVLVSLTMFAWQSFGAATRSIDGDAVLSADHTKAYTMPTSAGTLIDSGTIVQEAPAGTVNGSNVTFTLSFTPLNLNLVDLKLDGVVLEQGAGKDYTISGATITMLTAPVAGQSLLALYSK